MIATKVGFLIVALALTHTQAKAAAEAAKIRAAEEEKKRLVQEALGDFDLIREFGALRLKLIASR